MMTKLQIRSALAAVLLALSSSACFTGVESTPRISAADVKREKIVSTPEQKFLYDIMPEPPSRWLPGKKLHVTDNKIGLIFSEPSTAPKDALAGQDIEFRSFSPALTLTGDTVTDVTFVSGGGLLTYRSDLPYSQLKQAQTLDVPFTIERSVVDAVAEHLRGKRYYIVTPLWYDASGSQAVQGLRHVPVDIVDVLPGTYVYPFRIVFRQEGSDKCNSVYMTYGQGKSATRNFHTLFAFDNPRTRYPDITDDVWDLIIHSDVRNGMSRDECRLALGAPATIGQHPTRGYMAEHWQYTDGIYLVFEDGYLVFYRK